MRLALAAFVLSGCVAPAATVEDRAPLTDWQIVAATLDAWRADFDLPEHNARCDSEFPNLEITHAQDTRMIERCGFFTRGCMFYAEENQPRIFLLENADRGDAERVDLVVHETAHWLLGCSSGTGIDPDHTVEKIWEGWAPAFAEELLSE